MTHILSLNQLQEPFWDRPPQVHPTAIVEPGAQLHGGVKVDAYAYVGPEVVVGAGTHIHRHASVDGFTTLGTENEVYPYAFLGAKPHDRKYKGGRPGLKIGDRNLFREYVSVHLATYDGDYTQLGSDNILLAYSHVAHDCQVGDHLIISSHAALGGHVVIGDKVNIGWSAGVHQRCHIGSYAIVGACSKVVQDVPPFMMADGNPASTRTINRIGLERAGFTPEEIELTRTLYKHFYRMGLNRSQAMDKILSHPQAESWIVQAMLAFAHTSSRGWA